MSILALNVFFSINIYSQEKFNKLIIESNDSTILNSINESVTFEIDTLIMRHHSKLLFSENLKIATLFIKYAIIEDETCIIGSKTSVKYAAHQTENGQNASKCDKSISNLGGLLPTAARGNQGGNGLNGNDGENGADGTNITIFISFKKIGKLKIVSNGGIGGVGGNASNGGKGGQGSCSGNCNGGAGGTGGDGGNGGNGGNGGIITVYYNFVDIKSNLFTPYIIIENEGGQGGFGGNAGIGGNGGDKSGQCGAPPLYSKHMNGGPKGKDGELGKHGKKGNIGTSQIIYKEVF